MKKIVSVFLVVFISQSCLGNSEKIENLNIKQIESNLTYNLPVPEKANHNAWDVLLKKYVDAEGFVDYKGFLTNKSELDKYINYLSQNIPNESWNFQEQLAYYINLYNSLTVNLILDNYPVESIKDINKPWEKAVIKLGGKEYSLGDIEHNILRKMNEPRIHFAINCASYSCPNLFNEAYTASKIEEQLERISYNFINGNKNEISTPNPKLSKIFKWYKKDFKINGESDVIQFINQYSNEKIDANTDIKYLDYNWSLNQKV